MSALADCSEILGWLENFEQPPQRGFIILGEPQAASSLCMKIEDQSIWVGEVTKLREKDNVRYYDAYR